MSVSFVVILVLAVFLTFVLTSVGKPNDQSRQQGDRFHHPENDQKRSSGLLPFVLFGSLVFVGGILLLVLAYWGMAQTPSSQVTHLSPPARVVPTDMTTPESMSHSPLDDSSQDGFSDESATETADSPALLNPEIGEGSVVASEENMSAQSQAITPALNFRTDFLIVGGLVSLVLLVFLIGAGVWIAHQRQHWTMAKFQSSAGQFVWLLPMLVALGWVGVLYAPFLSLSPLERDTTYDASQVDYYRYQSDADVETEGQFQVATQGISPWVTNGKTNHQDKVLVPVHGGWRDSQSEAENFARRQAMRVLRNDFESTFPDARNWEIDLALNTLNATPRMETESRQFNLAGNQVEMYRTHLQVEVSDSVRAKMMDAWIPQLRTLRLTVLQVLMVFLMVVFFAIGGSLSIDMKTHGAYTRWIRFAALSVVMAAVVGAYLMRGSLLFYQHVV